jgi:type II secretory pathway component GspD/PulD (secretin)
MRTICQSLALCLLLSMPGICLSQQTDDPFAERPSVADPFGVDPFGGPKKKPVKPAKPAQQLRPQLVQPKILARPQEVPAKVVARRTLSDAELRIRAALEDQTSQTFIDVPLEEAAMQLSKTHHIPMLVDRHALEDIGLATDTPVRIGLEDVSLRSFLRLMLRELDLTYMVQNEVLIITTVEAAEQNLVLEMYKFPQQLIEKSDQVVEALTTGVVPDAWTKLGGPCTVTAIDNVLVVAATESIHDRVIDFLNKLDKAFE